MAYHGLPLNPPFIPVYHGLPLTKKGDQRCSTPKFKGVIDEFGRATGLFSKANAATGLCGLCHAAVKCSPSTTSLHGFRIVVVNKQLRMVNKKLRMTNKKLRMVNQLRMVNKLPILATTMLEYQ